MDHLPIVLEIVSKGLEKDPDAVATATHQLMVKLDEDGDMGSADRLRRLLNRTTRVRLTLLQPVTPRVALR